MNKRDRRSKEDNEKLTRYIMKKHAQYSNISQLQDGPNSSLLHAINSILDSLYPEYRKVIINEFGRQAKRGWWMDQYSRTSFYRVRAEACKQFTDNLKW